MSRRPPNRRPNSPALLQQPFMLGGAAGGAGETKASDVDPVVKTGLQKEFESALEGLAGDGTLDQGTRDALHAQFVDAMAAIESNDISAAGIPDRAMWMDAVQSLQQSGQLAAGEVDGLIRQINQALAPLQRRESQLAMEFSRRLETDGEEAALAWFRSASDASRDGATARVAVPATHADNVAVLRTDVTNSRSRRLRGPP